MSYEEHNSLTQARTWEGICTCYHTEMETADKTCYVTTNAQHTDSRPTSPSIDPVTLAMSLTHSILTAGRPVLVLTLYHQTSDRVAIREVSGSVVWLHQARRREMAATKPNRRREMAATKPNRRREMTATQQRRREMAATKPNKRREMAATKPNKRREMAATKPNTQREMAATKPRRREMAATQQRRREMAATKPNRRRVQHGGYQHFSEEENSTEIPSMYQVVCSASFYQLSSL